MFLKVVLNYLIIGGQYKKKAGSDGPNTLN